MGGVRMPWWIVQAKRRLLVGGVGIGLDYGHPNRSGPELARSNVFPVRGGVRDYDHDTLLLLLLHAAPKPHEPPVDLD